MNFYNLSLSELARLLKEQGGFPAYRAVQLFEWVYQRRVEDFSLMTNLSRVHQELLARIITFPKAAILERHISIDGTRKYLMRVGEDACVETVMIKQPTRMTLCVSSQIGCAMNCQFCRTATMGLKRNLSTAEIMQQVVGVIDDAREFGDMFTNIVFMGMGEPLHNINNVGEALRILTEHKGLAIPARKITVSTVGLVPAIKKFGQMCATAENGLANLAVSLNATTDDVRSRIMPINQRFPISTLLETLRGFPLKARKRITIEYVMLHGINDTEEDLRRLPKLLKGIPAKVNLIPYNTNADLGYQAPPREKIMEWQRVLTTQGMDATIRWSKGQDIKAACGQLATSSTRATKQQPEALVVLKTAPDLYTSDPHSKNQGEESSLGG